MKENFLVISFESTHYAMMAEKKLHKKFKADMIPTPRSITASCGLSLKMSMELMQNIKEALICCDWDSTMFHLYEIRKSENGDEAIPISLVEA